MLTIKLPTEIWQEIRLALRLRKQTAGEDISNVEPILREIARRQLWRCVQADKAIAEALGDL